MGVNRMGLCRHVLEYILILYHDFIHLFFYIYATAWYIPGFYKHMFLILEYLLTKCEQQAYTAHFIKF